MRGEVEGALVGGAAGCFTPGLFKETAQGMPLALLTKHFFFFFFFCHFFPCVLLGVLQSNPLSPSPSPPPSLSHLRMPKKLFLADIGPVSEPMFQMNITVLLRPRRRLLWEFF